MDPKGISITTPFCGVTLLTDYSLSQAGRTSDQWLELVNKHRPKQKSTVFNLSVVMPPSNRVGKGSRKVQKSYDLKLRLLQLSTCTKPDKLQPSFPIHLRTLVLHTVCCGPAET